MIFPKLEIAFLALVLATVSAESFEDPRPFLQRHQRSIEGQLCNVENNFNCSLAYTVCNKDTGVCECDRTLAVSMRMPLFPEVVQCIPLSYVNMTGLCLPTSPDICSLLVPGSFCDTSKRDGSAGKMKCACKIAGEYPNCIVRVGSVCWNNSTCTKDIPDAYCGNITNGFGKCTCGFVEDKGFISNRAGTACKATNCAAKPCRGDPSASTCSDTPSGYECACNNNTKGKSHDFSTDGICCNDHMVTCHDFSKCIKVTDLCNGISDCDDCSDEMQLYCTGPLPKKNPRCFRNFVPTVTVSKTKETSGGSDVPVSSANMAQQAAATSGSNIFTNPNQAVSGVRGNNGFYNPYSAAANILRTNVPALAIPGVELLPVLQGR